MHGLRWIPNAAGSIPVAANVLDHSAEPNRINDFVPLEFPGIAAGEPIIGQFPRPARGLLGYRTGGPDQIFDGKIVDPLLTFCVSTAIGLEPPVNDLIAYRKRRGDEPIMIARALLILGAEVVKFAR